MKIKFLASASPKKIGFSNSCFLLDERFLINAGASYNSLSLKEQSVISHIFLTSAEWMNIQDIPQLAEQRFTQKKPILNIAAPTEILTQLQKNILNSEIWPDYQNRIADGNTGLSILKLENTSPWNFEGYSVESFPFNETLTSYFVTDGESQLCFTERLNEPLLQQAKDKGATIFTSLNFPSKLRPLAEEQNKNCLEQLIEDYSQVELNTAIYIKAFTSNYFEELVEEFQLRAPKNFYLLSENDEVHI